MSIVDDIVSAIAEGVVSQLAGKRARRRKRRPTAADRLSQIEKILLPHTRQTSRKKTTRTRSTVQQKRVRARTQAHRKSLRVGKARR